MQIRIYYEDTDCGGIVYHTNYIKYCERARSEIFFSKTFYPFNEKASFVVSSLNANFISSAKLGDEIKIQTKVLKIKHVSANLLQEIFKIFDFENKKECNEKIFEMEVKLGCIDYYTHKPIAIPKELMEILNGK